MLDDFQQFLTEKLTTIIPPPNHFLLYRVQMSLMLFVDTSSHQPKYFIWEAGSFREGHWLCLRYYCVLESQRLRVGRNSLFDGFGEYLAGSVARWCGCEGLVLSIPPFPVQLSPLQRIKPGASSGAFLRSSFSGFRGRSASQGRTGTVLIQNAWRCWRNVWGICLKRIMNFYSRGGLGYLDGTI